MNIGLIDVDGHNFPNLALMKLARYHWERGDSVDHYNPFDHYDVVYMSKVFSFTPDYTQVIDNADKIIKGGTGYNLTTKLPVEVDRLQPDYSIYPKWPKDTALGFLTRGCIRKCPWCVVPRKEGGIMPYMDIEELMIEGRTKAVLMDNNIIASGDYGKGQLEKIIRHGWRIDFNQAMDARLVDEDWAKLMAKVKWIDRRIRFGCDTKGQIAECERAMELINRHGFKGEYYLFTMIGGPKSDFNESYSRVEYWHQRFLQERARKGNQPYPYAQPNRDPDKVRQNIPQWQKDLARWCINRWIFTSTEFKDFEPRKGFKCEQYLKDYGYRNNKRDEGNP